MGGAAKAKERAARAVRNDSDSCWALRRLCTCVGRRLLCSALRVGRATAKQLAKPPPRSALRHLRLFLDPSTACTAPLFLPLLVSCPGPLLTAPTCWLLRYKALCSLVVGRIFNVSTPRPPRLSLFPGVTYRQLELPSLLNHHLSTDHHHPPEERQGNYTAKMGKLGRFACVFTPMALSLAAFICLLLVFLGGLNKNDGNLTSIYFMKVRIPHAMATSPPYTKLTIPGRSIGIQIQFVILIVDRHPRHRHRRQAPGRAPGHLFGGPEGHLHGWHLELLFRRQQLDGRPGNYLLLQAPGVVLVQPRRGLGPEQHRCRGLAPR